MRLGEMMETKPSVAVLIPCYNEELTIEKVVRDFRAALPDATVYVYDNNCRDRTAEIAKKAGAIVRREPKQGKGNVVTTMFREIEADVYVLVDGDDTYPADEVQKLVDEVALNGMDMAIGDRLSNGTYFKENKRGFHDFGNRLVRNLINWMFHSDILDIMTGYRAFSRRFVKCLPITSHGFEIETEITAKSLVYGMNVKSVPITYRDRPAGSFSKLNTFADGRKVLVTLFNLFKDYRPMIFFSLIGLLFFILGLCWGIPVIAEFNATHYITKVPSAILAAGLITIAILLSAVGIILNGIKDEKLEAFVLHLNRYMERTGHRN